MEAFTNLLISWLSEAGGWAIFAFMLLESACIPIPSEVVLPFAGLLVSQGYMSFWTAVSIAVAGQLVGSTIAYLVGRRYGLGWLKKYGRYLGIRQHEVDKVESWLHRYGEFTVFFSRLLPAVRTFVSLPAGMGRMPTSHFIGYSALGVIPWTAVLVYAGVKLGDNWEVLRPLFHRLDFAIALVGLAVIALFLWSRRK